MCVPAVTADDPSRRTESDESSSVDMLAMIAEYITVDSAMMMHMSRTYGGRTRLHTRTHDQYCACGIRGIAGLVGLGRGKCPRG